MKITLKKLKSDPSGFMKACDLKADEICRLEDERILKEIYADLQRQTQKDQKN